MSHHDDDNCNFSTNESFQDVLARGTRTPLTRRNVIRGGTGMVALSALPFLTACGGGDDPAPAPATPTQNALGFPAVAKSLVDDVILPPGYTYRVLHATGDRLFNTETAYSNLGTETDDWSRRVGDHHDGMDLFYIDAQGNYTTVDTGRAVLVVNHESSADAHFFHPNGQTSGGVGGKKFSQFSSSSGGWDLGARPQAEVLKEINHHGVSLVEVRRVGGVWTVQLDSTFNRRVTPQTVVNVTGPSAHIADIRAFMSTQFDPSGVTARGTINNCGHGKTPWGTYLACEENWAAYFYMPNGSTDVSAKIKASRARYGVINAPFAAASGAPGQGWSTVPNAATDNRFGRWNVSAPGLSAADDFRNEPNTFGYNLEIDPLRPTAVPAKRVAMGRFAHEAAVCSIPVAGQPLAFYMGCDSQNEYIYKFVTDAVWDPADVGRGMAAGDKYLNEGKLYVAKFNDTGLGVWLELNVTTVAAASPAYNTYTFDNQADVLINARHAASAVGATRMDRPEWGAVNPKNGDVYFTMTNNSSRTVANADAANPRAYADNDGLTRSGNPNGHIIRFRETGSASTATTFNWDIFLFGAEEDAGAGINLSGLNDKNDFSSPDGLWFSKATGICYIQTDDGAYLDQTNCMLLAAIPGNVGDGRALTVSNSFNGNTGTEQTFIGAALGDAKLRRFLVGPKGAEITGMTESADGRTVFVNIQHPGENTAAIGTGTFNFQSQWPGNKGYGVAGRPRSATIVITRTDGGVIGL
ncbi:MAG: PhoX family protein [Hydrogenophaga sp.]